MKRYQGHLLATCLLSAVAPATAYAQEAAAPSDIVVTAQKRAQRLIDVPESVSVLTGAELKARGIETLQDISFAVPGLTMREDGPGTFTVFLRGIANQSGSSALVGMYLDEAPLTMTGFYQLSPDELDFARVEVLKGPQGTLYGLGSAAGTIRFITNKPKLDVVEGHVEGSLFGVAHGDIGGRGEAVINLPIVKDQLAVRIAGSYQDGGGWIDQPAAGIKNGNGTRTLSLRGKLLWKPADNFEAEATVQVHRARTQLGTGFEQPDRTIDVAIDRSERLIPKTYNFEIYNLELRYDLGFAKLVSATTYDHFHHDYPFTYIPTVQNYSYGTEGNDTRYVHAHQISEEVRLQSSGKPFEYTIGAFYRDEKDSLLDSYEYLYAGTVYNNLYYFNAASSRSISVFADADYHITSKLIVGAGVRYFHDRVTGLTEYAPGTGVAQEAKFHSVDPRVYLQYKFTPQFNVYASWAKGFRSGGFNLAPIPAYNPEKLDTWEVGAKAATANGRLSANLALFTTQYKDAVRRRLVFDNGAYLSELSNIGRIRAKGVEFGLTARPVRALTLDGSVSYLHSVITATDPGDPVNLPGDRVDYTPKWSFTIGANYDYHWSSKVPGFIRVDFSHRDHVTYIDRSSFPAQFLPQVSDTLNLLDARIGATFGKLRVEVFGTNLADKNKAIDPYVAWENANRTQPRTLGVKFGYDF